MEAGRWKSQKKRYLYIKYDLVKQQETNKSNYNYSKRVNVDFIYIDRYILYIRVKKKNI